jgi:hypothetical protein
MLAPGSPEAAQNEAAAALHDLALDPAISCLIGAVADAVPRLVALLETESVRLNASWALRRLALYLDNAARIEAVADCVPRMAPLLAAGTPVQLKLNVIMTLCASVTAITAGRLAAAGAIPSLVELLHGIMQTYAVGLLLVMIEAGGNVDAVAIEIAAAGAMPVLNAIRDAGLPHVKRSAASILRHLM